MEVSLALLVLAFVLVCRIVVVEVVDVDAEPFVAILFPGVSNVHVFAPLVDCAFCELP